MADSGSKEYSRRLAELENYISDNRLVSKEAQMSLLSGEGYKDPRFTVGFDNSIIDKFALHPLAAEGSGYEPSTGDLGMEGPDSMLNSSVGGTYNPNTDVVKFKDPNKGMLEVLASIEGGIEGLSATDIQSKEDIQKHELIHRAAEKSGYLDYLGTSEFLKENSTTKYLKGGTAKTLKHVINEALAESYEDTDNLESRIKFRVNKFNIKEDKKQEIAKALFENIDVLKEDFETYLESLMNPDEIPNRMDEIMVENDF
tara:strand:- start:170 stop:940 length:771 start_codon:yes stop_codon:yes gene_type:complete